MPMQWKEDYFELVGHIDRVLDTVMPDSRVTALIRQYGAVMRGLLIAEVNGGLDQCFMEFPDAPEMEICKHGERCYCDLLKEREDFIRSKGLWEEFTAYVSVLAQD